MLRAMMFLSLAFFDPFSLCLALFLLLSKPPPFLSASLHPSPLLLPSLQVTICSWWRCMSWVMRWVWSTPTIPAPSWLLSISTWTRTTSSCLWTTCRAFRKSTVRTFCFSFVGLLIETSFTCHCLKVCILMSGNIRNSEEDEDAHIGFSPQLFFFMSKTNVTCGSEVMTL